MSAHVLLNLLNEYGKRYKMRGLPSNLSLFRNEVNKFNNTRARMLDYIYHMRNTLKSDFWRKKIQWRIAGWPRVARRCMLYVPRISLGIHEFDNLQ